MVRVSAMEFVLAFKEAHKVGESESWVAKRLNISRQAVNQRKKLYIQHGVKVPKLNKSVYRGEKIDADALNKILDVETPEERKERLSDMWPEVKK